jgi:hypothetical protein
MRMTSRAWLCVQHWQWCTTAQDVSATAVTSCLQRLKVSNRSLDPVAISACLYEPQSLTLRQIPATIATAGL